MGRSEEEDKLDLMASEKDDGKLMHDEKPILDGAQPQGDTLVLSTLPKTWLFDLDGTLVKHNGYKIDGHDTLLPGAKEYVESIPAEDKVIILTSRTDEYRDSTLEFLREHGIRYDEIIFNMPMGERIVVNDRKPSGIDMAVAVNLDRDVPVFPKVERVL